MLTEEQKKTVRGILAPELADERVLSMRRFIQHGDVTTLAHCMAVADKSYELALRWRLIGKIDLPVMLRAALLHDFCLYDWHEKDKSHQWHGFHHAERAMNNARDLLGVSPREQAIIYSHMWPLNLTHLPRSREAWIVTIADKLVASGETVRGKMPKRKAPAAGGQSGSDEQNKKEDTKPV